MLHNSEYQCYIKVDEFQCCIKVTSRVGQNRISAPYMTVCMVVSLLKVPYVHRIYMVLAIPINVRLGL